MCCGCVFIKNWLTFVPNGPTDNKSALLHMMAKRLIGTDAETSSISSQISTTFRPHANIISEFTRPWKFIGTLFKSSVVKQPTAFLHLVMPILGQNNAIHLGVLTFSHIASWRICILHGGDQAKSTTFSNFYWGIYYKLANYPILWLIDWWEYTHDWTNTVLKSNVRLHTVPVFEKTYLECVRELLQLYFRIDE